jgi:phosphonatase-like hydrolase
MAIELVVFDMSGTTVADGDAVNRALRATLAAAGVTVPPAWADAVMGLPKPIALRLLIERAGRGDRLSQIATLHAQFVARMTRFFEEERVAEVPGTSATFAALHRAGIKVGLNTGFSRPIAQRLIDRLGWARAGGIDASVTSDEVSRGRPHPDMIQRLMAMLDITSSRHVAKVGDTPADLEEGANAACGRVIGVTSGTHTHEQLIAYPHTDLIGSVADLPRLLGIEEV